MNEASKTLEVEAKVQTTTFQEDININGQLFGEMTVSEIRKPGTLIHLDCSGVLTDLSGDYLLDNITGEDDIQWFIELVSANRSRRIEIMEYEADHSTRVDVRLGPIYLTMLFCRYRGIGVIKNEI